MKLRISAAVLALALATPFAFAQTMRIGFDVTTPNGTDLAPADTRTDISLDAATANGGITSVTVYWSEPNCTNAFKIAAFRRSGDLLRPMGERGPFSVTSNVTTIDLTHGYSFSEGDLIGVVRVGNCGSVATLSGVPTEGYLSFEGDVTTNRTIVDGQRVNSALAIFATGPAYSKTTAVVPVVGSVNGAFGSLFKTSLQLLNPTSSPMTGTITFQQHGDAHGQGTGLEYSLFPGQQLSVDNNDLFGSTPSAYGIGTLAVGVPTGQGMPQIVARVYNDAGTDGTAGFYEEPILVSDTGPGGHVITKGATAYMVAPVEPTRTRFNIGVRSLFSGADLTAELLDSVGRVLASTTTHYPADYMEQVDAASFFGGVPVGKNRTIKITVTDGAAIVYGATTDNVTNDPSLQYAVVAPAAQ